MITANGHRLHVLCQGRGSPTVVFESGIAASSLSWSLIQPEVSRFTRSCAYDRAGLGWSESARGKRTAAEMVDDLRVVLQSAGPPPYVLVGHSFGTFLVCAFAAEHPARVAALVLLDPPTEWNAMSRQQSRLLWGGIQLSRLGALLARLGIVRACLVCLSGGAPAVPRTFVRAFGTRAAHTLTRLVGEVRKLPPQVQPVVQALWCQPKCFESMASHLAALPDTGALIDRITTLPDVPLVIVSAGDHSAKTLEQHERLARLSPGGRHVIAAASNHWVQFDEPELVITTIREAVDQARK